MQYIDFKVQHQTITRTDKYQVVGGSENYLRARFTFCEEWADITPTAVFSTNSGKHISVAIENGECLVPWEVLRSSEFWVGVFGGERMTTSTARVAVKPGVKFNASPGVQPTPTAYEKLVGIVTDSAEAADSAKNAAAESAEDAKRYAAASQESAEEASGKAAASQIALQGVQDALNNLPAGGTLVINDLTVGGTSAALSAEMGKNLNTRLVKTETPSLSVAKKKQLKDLVGSYTTRRTNFLYNGNVLRNVYVGNSDRNKPFVEDGGTNKVSVNCGLFCGLLWAGVHPRTFVDYLNKQDDFTGVLNKYFDWGYEFKYPNRKAYGIKNEREDGTYTLYGFLQPCEGSNYTGASSYNSFYSPSSENTFKQKFYSYATAADMAWEMFTNGYEIQMKDIDVGDLLFFRARSLSDDLDDYDEAFRFRNITHVGMVSDVAIVNGQKVWSIAESTPMVGENYSVANLSHTSTSAVTITRLVSLNNHICMVARHPAAFGVASNLGDKFTEI